MEKGEIGSHALERIEFLKKERVTMKQCILQRNTESQTSLAHAATVIQAEICGILGIKVTDGSEGE